MITKNRFSINIIIFSIMLILTACDSLQTPINRVGSLNIGTAYRVFVQDNYAFVADNDGVVIIDITRRDHPKKVALVELSEAAFGVYAQDNLVFIASPAGGLVIADVQEKSNPKIIGAYVSGGINEVCVNDHIAYASTQQGELRIINVENPTRPYLLGTYDAGDGPGLMVACLENIVYFSTSNKGLDVLDVSDSSSPIKTETIARTQGAKDIQFVGDLLYLSCVGNGVRVLSIANRLAPKTITSFNNGGEAWGVGGDSKTLWIGDLQEGIELYDMSNPQAPVLIAQDPHYAPHDIFFDGEYAYLADQDRGFIILEYRENSRQQ
jgi:hypothetical protein